MAQNNRNKQEAYMRVMHSSHTFQPYIKKSKSSYAFQPYVKKSKTTAP